MTSLTITVIPNRLGIAFNTSAQLNQLTRTLGMSLRMSVICSNGAGSFARNPCSSGAECSSPDAGRDMYNDRKVPHPVRVRSKKEVPSLSVCEHGDMASVEGGKLT